MSLERLFFSGFDEKFPSLKAAEEYSKEEISIIDSKFRDLAPSDKVSLVANGSFARLEATRGSDFDYIILHDGECDRELERLRDGTNKILQEMGIPLPAQDGAFGESCDACSLLRNLGGLNDDNASITRRILFLIESSGVFNRSMYEKSSQDLIERYIGEGITDHQIALFMLNDLIRYYRTICVDFEYKTTEAGKPWGIRNIKLIFSRKLIYFASVVLIAETAQRTRSQKINKVMELIALTPLERLHRVFGDRVLDTLGHYERFHSCVNDPETREFLKNIRSENDIENRRHERFREIKNEGRHFSWALLRLLNEYPASHPIHSALLI